MTLALKNIPSPTPRKWTREEYYRLAEEGYFRDQRVMLIEGDIVTMPPQKNNHAWTITILAEKLREVFGKSYFIREEKPLHIGSDSEPEPDIAVIAGSAQDWRGKPHPTTGVLVVEVSDSSVEFDRAEKSNLYASAGVPEYWVVNLRDRLVEVHRLPIANPAVRFGHKYSSVTTYEARDSISSLQKPGEMIAIADFLP